MTQARRPVILSELLPDEARAIFDRFMSGQPERLAEFLGEVRRRGGPVEQLDYSIESLEPLWTWFIAAHRPRRWFGGPHRMPSSPASDADMRGAEWLVVEPLVEEAVHEDREVILVRAPALSPSELENIVAELWKRRTGRSHAGSA